MYTNLEEDIQVLIKRLDEIADELGRYTFVDLGNSRKAIYSDREAVIKVHDASVLRRYEKDASIHFYRFRFEDKNE